MDALIGKTLSHYHIVEKIGAGGMGQVYRAHDPRLGRDVAIKVLSPHLSAAPEVRARFEREAQTISQLNHPHICVLHDVGREGDTDYLVMELVEGETLSQRLLKGPLPTADVLRLGAQIAEALDRAHRAGVVHRDLKPGNVMLTKSGVKLMDFGLARAAVPITEAGAPADSPTMSRPLTAEGTIVGTFQYMAPEQLEGKEADARSDIWALGCVLYEMATGARAFEGKSQASLIAAILEHEPRPMLELQPLAPPALEHHVRRCLAKDPDARWQSAGDVARELQWISETDSRTGAPVPLSVRARPRERLAWAVAVAALAIAFAAHLWVDRAPSHALARLSISAPAGAHIQTDFASAAISPDGRRLVFSAVDSIGGSQLWLRSLNSYSAQPITGTDGAVFPFWSPDSRFIAFFSGRMLRKVPAAGGAPEAICDAPDARGGSWSKHGDIVFAPLGSGPLMRIPSEGGEVRAVVRPDSARGETALRFPCFLPDGKHFLYVSLPKRHGQFDVYLGALNSGETSRVMSAGSAPVYAEPGYLLFERLGRLVAQRFDRSRLRPAGDVVSLGDAPSPGGYEGAPILCAPSRYVLASVTAGAPQTELTWLDRGGRTTSTMSLTPGSYAFPTLSPDGRKAAVVKFGVGTSCDLWAIELERSVSSRLTFDGAVTAGTNPWSPDGTRIAFASSQSGPYDIYAVLASGTGHPEPLLRSSVTLKFPSLWSPDGKYLVFFQQSEATGWDVWLLPMTGDHSPVPYLVTPFNEFPGDVSPDGHWLAYASDESGTSEVYVSSFPVPGQKYRVSISGATGAQWSRDGRELILWTGSGSVNAFGPVLSVDVQTMPSFRAGKPRPLFTPPQAVAGMVATADLSRFLAAIPTEHGAGSAVAMILNWQEALRR